LQIAIIGVKGELVEGGVKEKSVKGELGNKK
jgi:hypothetical protein